MDNGCILCEQKVPKKVAVPVEIEPGVWGTWYVSPELVEQVSKLVSGSRKTNVKAGKNRRVRNKR